MRERPRQEGYADRDDGEGYDSSAGGKGTENAIAVARMGHRAADTTLALTVPAASTAVDCRRSREAGFDHHLTKPTDLDDLLRVMASR